MKIIVKSDGFNYVLTFTTVDGVTKNFGYKYEVAQ